MANTDNVPVGHLLPPHDATPNPQNLGPSSTTIIDPSVNAPSPTVDPRTPKKSVSFTRLPTDAIKMSRSRSETRFDEPDERTSMLVAGNGAVDYSTIHDSSAGQSSAVSNDVDPSTATKRRGKDRQADGDTGERKNGGGRWSKFVDKYGSVELENKGSVARDHLALERTFLAWLRTSLSFASIGIAVTQLFRLNTTMGNINPDHPAVNHLQKVGKPLGGTFIAIAIVILFVGFHRYFEGQHYIIRGKFPASRGSIIMVALLALGLSTVSLVVVLVVGGKSLGTTGG